MTDFASYPDWNPFMRSVAGSPLVGERLAVTITPPGGGKPMSFRPIRTRAGFEAMTAALKAKAEAG